MEEMIYDEIIKMFKSDYNEFINQQIERENSSNYDNDRYWYGIAGGVVYMISNLFDKDFEQVEYDLTNR